MRKFFAAALVFTLLLMPLPVFAEGLAGRYVAELTLELRGLPFQFGGEDRTGFDASGLLVYVFGQFGVSLPRTTAQQATVGTAVTRAQLRAGDIVLFASGSTRWTGIFVGNNAVVWASPSAGVVRQASLAEASVSSLFRGARRIPESAFDRAILVLATAAEYLGTPYVFGADGPNSFDCSGFTRYVFAKHGIALPRTSINQASAGVRVPIAERRKGDLLVFVDTWRPGISHVGIYVGDGEFIHATTREGVSYANLRSTYWGSRLHSVRRLIP
jgi:cell wall-associated NlpC family hydrolase